MRVTLVGYQPIDFTNGEGERINGSNIFTNFKDTNVDGFRTGKFFLREGISLPKDVKLNDEIEISFDYKARIEKIQKA